MHHNMIKRSKLQHNYMGSVIGVALYIVNWEHTNHSFQILYYNNFY
jgi:hypothetical protein